MLPEQSSAGSCICPLCGAGTGVLVGAGYLRAHRRGRAKKCPASGWAPSYVRLLLDRETVSQVEAELRQGMEP